MMTRRKLLTQLAVSGLFGRAASAAAQSPAQPPAQAPARRTDRLELTEEQWKQRLTPAQYQVLRQEGTERAFTSALNAEKRKGVYKCVGCDLPLFTSSMKYDSGTGWPSFFETLPNVFGFKTDYKHLYPRTEYHCARCGGHHGHVFDDGPRPTGKRYCNNGVCLKFEPEAA
jgi:peptide-methionine (R)-S-oxide reductase